MVIHNNASKIYKFLVLQVTFFLLKFIRALFVRTIFFFFYSFIAHNHVIVNNTFCILTIFTSKCGRISSITFFTRMMLCQIFYTHTNIYCYSLFNSSYIFCHQTYMHIFRIYVLLIIYIHSFLLSYLKHSSLKLLFDLEHIHY